MKFKLPLLILSLGLFIFSCGGNGNSHEASSTSNASAHPAVTKVKKADHAHGQASVKDDVSAANILKIAMGSKDHTTLVAAVKAAGIEHVIVNAGPLTVFAPTNAAFDALPKGTVETLLKPENKAKLAGILTSHAAPGVFDKKQLKKEARKKRKIYTAAGDYLTVEVKGDDIYVEGAKVLGEVRASNGVVVVVDKVILPKK